MTAFGIGIWDGDKPSGDVVLENQSLQSVTPLSCLQVKPPDVTGAQLHRDQHHPQSPSGRRPHRNDSFDSSIADDQYHTLLPLQRRTSSAGSRDALVASGARSPGAQGGQPGAGFSGRGGSGAALAANGHATEMGDMLGGAHLTSAGGNICNCSC